MICGKVSIDLEEIEFSLHCTFCEVFCNDFSEFKRHVLHHIEPHKDPLNISPEEAHGMESDELDEDASMLTVETKDAGTKVRAKWDTSVTPSAENEKPVVDEIESVNSSAEDEEQNLKGTEDNNEDSQDEIQLLNEEDGEMYTPQRKKPRLAKSHTKPEIDTQEPSDESGLHKCNQCPAPAFKSFAELRRHVRRWHRTRHVPLPKVDIENLEPEMLECEHCYEEPFEHLCDLQAHVRRKHENMPCIGVHPEEYWVRQTCWHCTVRFETFEAFLGHLGTMLICLDRAASRLCELCGELSSMPKNNRLHRRARHLEVDKFMVRVCNHPPDTEETNTHKFKCPVCPPPHVTFSCRRCLNRHKVGMHNIKLNQPRTYMEFNIMALSDEEFFQTFTVSKRVYKFIFGEVAPYLKKPLRRTCVPMNIKLAAFMGFLVRGGYQREWGHELARISQAAVSHSIGECLNVFEKYLRPEWIQWPQTDEDTNKIMRQFEDRFAMSGVLSCVDGMNVRIVCPSDKVRHLYKNKLGHHTVKALLACDSDLVVRYVDSHHIGVTSDAQMWRESKLEEQFRTNYDTAEQNSWLLGDKAFPLLPYLMTPFTEPATDGEIEYNDILRHIRRSTVEKCIRMLRRRFKCLVEKEGLHFTPEKTGKILNACLIVHNIGIRFQDGWTAEDDDEVNEEDEPTSLDVEELYTGSAKENIEMVADAFNIREQLANGMV